jgi:hypothetical protein
LRYRRSKISAVLSIACLSQKRLAIDPRVVVGSGSCPDKDTADSGPSLGLRLCFTSVSPESDRVSEALVKAIERDYARLSVLPDAERDQLLPSWLED